MRCGSKQDTIALLLHTELQRNSKANVLSDMHVLLSAAKNSTALRNSKTNVLPDMLSGCIEYKDLRSEKHTYKLAIVSKRIEKSLYLIPADCKSAGTIALLLNTRRHGRFLSQPCRHDKISEH